MGIFTEMAILLSKYQPAKFVEHLKVYVSRINIPQAVEKAHMWPELAFLYIKYDEFVGQRFAAVAMIKRSADAWEHNQFKDVVVRVANLEIYYRALSFYLEEHPNLLTDLLTIMIPRINHPRVLNVEEVNDAYNDLLIEEEDYKPLRDLINNFDKFNTIALAKRLQVSPLLVFRRLAAHLYQLKMARIYCSIERSQGELMSHFVDITNPEYFSALLYICFDLLRSDVVEELSWQHGLNDFYMPYKSSLQHRRRRSNNERSKKEVQEAASHIINPGKLMITNGPTGFAGQAPHMNGMMPQMTGFC
ncbi:armadillo-type protein [Mycena sanguinolenta]|nr:armadillo-type protein [Mycena sanguinolenta]